MGYLKIFYILWFLIALHVHPTLKAKKMTKKFFNFLFMKSKKKCPPQPV